MTEVKFEFPERPEEGLRDTGLFDIFEPFKKLGLAKAEEAGLPSAVSTAADWLTPDGPNLIGIAQALSSPVLKSLPKLRFPKILLKDIPPESNVKLTEVPSNFDLLDGLIKGHWIRGTNTNTLESKIPKHRYFKEHEKDLEKIGKDSPFYELAKMGIEDGWENSGGMHISYTKPPMTIAKSYNAVDHEGIHSKIDELADHISKGVDKDKLTNSIYEQIEKNLWRSTPSYLDGLGDPMYSFLKDEIGYRPGQIPAERLSWMYDILSGQKGDKASKNRFRNYLESTTYLREGDEDNWIYHLDEMKKTYKDIVSRLNDLDESSFDNFIKSGVLPHVKKGNK